MVVWLGGGVKAVLEGVLGGAGFSLGGSGTCRLLRVGFVGGEALEGDGFAGARGAGGREIDRRE